MRRESWLAGAVMGVIVLAGSGVPAAASARLDVPPGNPVEAVGTGNTPGVFDITITAREETVDLGSGLLARAVTFNGTVPGPTFRVRTGQRVRVLFKNELPELASGIHWHGIELNNRSDGTGITQNHVKPGEEFVYDFIPPREGVYWYHPHMSPTNVEFKGQYGAFIVEGPINDQLVRAGVIPGRKHTRLLVLGDTTVCKAVGANDAATFPADPALPWVGDEEALGPYPGLLDPRTPVNLCEDNPLDDEGNPALVAFDEGDIPNIQPKAGCAGPATCRTNEGQLVLTNGVVVAPRAGSPTAPGALGEGPGVVAVRSGEGWRLQMVNTSVTRYYRLRLTDNGGTLITLIRIGGQGGILDRPRIEGGVLGLFDTKFLQGEIVLGPGERSDVVFTVPDGLTGEVLTLWTQDYARQGAGPGKYSPVPTVPVAHFRLAEGPRTQARTFSIDADTILRSGATATENLKDDFTDLLALPPGGIGTTDRTFRLTTVGGAPGIDSVATPELHGGFDDFTTIPPFPVSRFARLGTTVELRWRNETLAHHPLHLHGFSIQPVRIEDNGGPTIFTYPYNEFVDTIDVHPGTTVVFRVHFEDRPNADGTPGGGLGRWVMHCHIFFHSGLGMNAEIQVLDSNGAQPVTASAGAAPAPSGASRTGGGAGAAAAPHRH